MARESAQPPPNPAGPFKEESHMTYRMFLIVTGILSLSVPAYALQGGDGASIGMILQEAREKTVPVVGANSDEETQPQNMASDAAAAPAKN